MDLRVQNHAKVMVRTMTNPVRHLRASEIKEKDVAKVKATVAAAMIAWAAQVNDTMDAIYVEASGMIERTAQQRIDSSSRNNNNHRRRRKAKAKDDAIGTTPTSSASPQRTQRQRHLRQDRARQPLRW